ncbi:MAG: type II secretion system F family protein, partial [Gammaproteobacteria bacterium]
KSTTVNSVMVEMIDAARLNLKQGRAMSGAFADDRKFPKMAIQMLRLGEETGNLQSVLDKMSATYDREVSAAMQRLLSLFEPILILVLGVMIAGIIFSVLMAVVSINDFVF